MNPPRTASWTLPRAPGGAVTAPAPASGRARNTKTLGCRSGWRWCSCCARQAGGSRHCCSRSRREPHDGRGPVRPPRPAARAARTTRPGRSRGAAATCRRAPRAPPRREPAALPLPASPSPPASGHADRAGGCGSAARSPPAADDARQAAARSRGTSPATTTPPRGSSPGAATRRRRARNAARRPSPRLEPGRVVGEQREVSRPGESHPRALAELYVNVSAHTAPIIQPPASANDFAWLDGSSRARG